MRSRYVRSLTSSSQPNFQCLVQRQCFIFNHLEGCCGFRAVSQVPYPTCRPVFSFSGMTWCSCACTQQQHDVPANIWLSAWCLGSDTCSFISPSGALREGVCTSASHAAGVWMGWMVDPAAGERAHWSSLSFKRVRDMLACYCWLLRYVRYVHLERCHVMSVSAVNDGSRLHTC